MRDPDPLVMQMSEGRLLFARPLDAVSQGLAGGRALTRPLKAGTLFPQAAGEESTNAIAPILGDGLFTKPGADGGDALRSTELIAREALVKPRGPTSPLWRLSPR